MDSLNVLADKAALFAKASSLADLYTAYKAIPVSWTLTGHCLFAATMAPEFKDRFRVHFWVSTSSAWRPKKNSNPPPPPPAPECLAMDTQWNSSVGHACSQCACMLQGRGLAAEYTGQNAAAA